MVPDLFASVAVIHTDPWETVLEALWVDPVERRVLTELTEQFRAAGTFRDPVHVTDKKLMNGYHRTAVAWRERQPLDVWVDGPGFPYPSPPGQETGVSFRVQPTDRFSMTGFWQDNDWQSVAVTAVRSLPVGETWIEADCAVGGATDDDGGCVVTYFYYDADRDLDALVAAAVDRFAEFGLRAEFVATE